jgi:hypothetical protein
MNGLKAYTALKDDVVNIADGHVWHDVDEPESTSSLDQLRSPEAV